MIKVPKDTHRPPKLKTLFPVGEQRLLVRLSRVLGARMPTYTREATEDHTGNHEDRSDERGALHEHELVSLGAAWSS
jgi:hypothetical protein